MENFILEDLPGATLKSCSMSTRKLASLEEVILCQCERLPQVTRCNAGFLSPDGVTSRGCFVALAETFNCTADTNRLGISRHRYFQWHCIHLYILSHSSIVIVFRSSPFSSRSTYSVRRFLYLLRVLVSLCVLPCSFLPPSSYAIVGYDTVKDAELAADEHSSAVLDNYQLAVFSYPSLQQSNAGTGTFPSLYYLNTEMFPNLGIDCSQWTHCT